MYLSINLSISFFLSFFLCLLFHTHIKEVYIYVCVYIYTHNYGQLQTIEMTLDDIR